MQLEEMMRFCGGLIGTTVYRAGADFTPWTGQAKVEYNFVTSAQDLRKDTQI